MPRIAACSLIGSTAPRTNADSSDIARVTSRAVPSTQRRERWLHERVLFVAHCDTPQPESRSAPARLGCRVSPAAPGIGSPSGEARIGASCAGPAAGARSWSGCSSEAEGAVPAPLSARPLSGERSSALLHRRSRPLGMESSTLRRPDAAVCPRCRHGVDSPKGAGGIQQAVREERDRSRWLPTSSPTKSTMSSIG